MRRLPMRVVLLVTLLGGDGAALLVGLFLDVYLWFKRIVF